MLSRACDDAVRMTRRQGVLTGLLFLAIFLAATLGLAERARADHTAATPHSTRQWRVFIVSSYDRNYIWSQQTQRGVNAAMRKLGYLANDAEERELGSRDAVENSHIVIRKAWMDTKRRDEPLHPAVPRLRRVRDHDR